MKWDQERGFNLLESIFVLIIFSVLFTFAVPHFSDSIRKAKMKKRISEFINMLNIGQSESLKRNKKVYLHYIPLFTQNSGCIGLSENEIHDFNCVQSEINLMKFDLGPDDLFKIDAPLIHQKEQIIYFSPFTGLPSQDKTFILTFKQDALLKTKIFIRKYKGITACSDLKMQRWDLCSS